MQFLNVYELVYYIFVQAYLLIKQKYVYNDREQEYLSSYRLHF